MPLDVAVVAISYRILFYWFLRSEDSRQRKCHAVADDATSWNSIYYNDRSNLAVEIHFLEFL